VREQINIASIIEAVQDCCRGETECSTCTGKDCLIGFAKLVSEFARSKNTLSIPNGLKMIPTKDYKVYDTDFVATALAVINHECKNCMDNHDDNCIINIIRSTLEVALIGEHIDFSGNPLAYLINISQRNPEMGGKVMEKYKMLKDN
jgi:hypothetical protein